MDLAGLLKAIAHAIGGILSDTAPYWAPVLALAAALALAARFGIPALAQWWDRRRRHIPRALAPALTALLAHEGIQGLYAPAARYVRDVPEGRERPRTHAWASAHPRAVKAAAKRNGRTPAGQYFDARRLIRDTAQHVTVRPLTEDERGLLASDPDNPYSAYVIRLDYAGHKPEDVEKLAPALAAQLALKHMERLKDDDPTGVSWLASTRPYRDPLEDATTGAEWFDAHPAKTPALFPAAVGVRGDPIPLPLTHTLIYGQTGSGKSGPMLATIRQLAPYIERGTVKLYGIDPKHDDLEQFRGTSLLEDIATRPDESRELIERYVAMLDERAAGGLQDGARYHVLLIDEVVKVINALNRTKEGRNTMTLLEDALSMGRSNGFYVMMATVNAKVEKLEGLRDSMVNKIIFHQESDHLNDLFLGKTARDDGYDSTTIRPSTEGNGYATSGIGYMKGETGEPTRFRIAYQSRDELRAFITAHTHAEQVKSKRARAAVTAGTVRAEWNALAALPLPEDVPDLSEDSDYALQDQQDSDDLPDL